ncbi:MAG: gamma-glutamyl-gamma-aminobutyrate hydrolase family protein [Microthrixaceae bacterium]|nr:gamma-glutamyl-gamma-aminobutyrate hydrolase family protein [Microthrixaceae bacterium]
MTSRRPVIAVTCQRREPGTVFKLEPGVVVISDYLDAIWRAGGLPVPVYPPMDSVDDAVDAAREVIAQCDGVVAIGGLDVDPARYGQAAHETTMPAPPDQEAFELALIDAALDTATPLLAICRGLQLLNVALGGSLHQHITGAEGWQQHGVPNGGGGSTNDYHVEPGSLIASVVDGSTISGRCHHHQAVDRVAESLTVTGRTADGCVEAMELADPANSTRSAAGHDTGGARPWLLAVQWHPEETASKDPANQALFDAVVAASAAATTAR